MDNSTNDIQKQLLWLCEVDFIDLTVRQQNMLNAFVDKYQKMGLPPHVYNQLIKDAKLLILFS